MGGRRCSCRSKRKADLETGDLDVPGVFLHIETFPASNSRFGCLAQPRSQEWDSLFFTPEMLARDPNSRDTNILYGKIPKDTSRNSTKR